MFRKKQGQQAADHHPQPILRCSFCNKSQDNVRKLIAGPSIFICDECVEVCNDIIADDARFEAASARPAVPEVKDGAEPKRLPDIPVSGPAVRCALCRMPTPLEDGILIPARGVLCPGCIGAIEATVAEKRRDGW